jgi:hypothetical protein
VAVHYAGSASSSYDECIRDEHARALYRHEDLPAADRRWLDDWRLRRLAGSEPISEADNRRAASLEARDFRIGIFAGHTACGTEA